MRNTKLKSASLLILAGIAGMPYENSAFGGAVSGATVTAYELNTNGSRGAVVGSTTTDSSGNYNITLTTTPTNPVEVVVSGGTYIDSASGASATLSTSISSILPSVAANATNVAAVNTLTNLAVGSLKADIAAGNAVLNSTHIDEYYTATASAYGLSGVNLITLEPASPAASGVSASSAQAKALVALASISQAAASSNVTPEVMAKKLGEGFHRSNGVISFTGADTSNAPITVGTSTMNNAFFSSNMASAAAAFLSGPQKDVFGLDSTQSLIAPTSAPGDTSAFEVQSICLTQTATINNSSIFLILPKNPRRKFFLS